MQHLNAGQIVWQVRRQLPLHIYDTTSGERSGMAIYSLADPADLHDVRYVGLTRSPRRRYLQHIGGACLWIGPTAMEWSAVPPRLRPPYLWIRELYETHSRLPVMIVSEWFAAAKAARAAERALISRCLANGMGLLNHEAQAARSRPYLV